MIKNGSTKMKGNLRKMYAKVDNADNVHYSLALNDNDIDISNLVGQEVSLHYTGVINCISCGKTTKKSYAQGFCFNCMQTSPETEDCVLRPALCKAHLGVARDMDYAKSHCLKPHFVYLANTGDIKVGVTRESQIPVRWMDQGASAAIKLCKTPNRHIAGLLEAFLGKTFTDKTSWKKMVTNSVDDALDLKTFRDKALSLLSTEMLPFVCDDDIVYKFNYPVICYPDNPENINLDITSNIKGILNGVKGQYLLFNNNRVLNLRRHTGYFVEINY